MLLCFTVLRLGQLTKILNIEKKQTVSETGESVILSFDHLISLSFLRKLRVSQVHQVPPRDFNRVRGTPGS